MTLESRARHPQSVRRVPDQPDRLPVQLRQLPAERGAGQQLPGEPRRTAGARRYDLENPAQYATERRLAEQRLRPVQPESSRRRRSPSSATRHRVAAGHPADACIKENRWVGKANLDWQFDRYNRLKFGGEFTRYDIGNYSHQLDDQIFSDVYLEKPIRWNAFARGSARPGRRGPGRRSAVRLVSHPGQAAGGTASPGHLDPSRRSTRTIRMRSSTTTRSVPRGQGHDYLSPHVQVSFPVTERTNFRLSYAHQVQAPDFGVVLQGINTDLNLTNTNNVYGSDLDFGKYDHLRVRHPARLQRRHGAGHRGLQQGQPGQRGRPAGLAARPAPRASTATSGCITNADFGNTRGIDVRLDRRFGNLFNGTLSYSYQDAKNTGSDPDTYIDFGSRVLNAGLGRQPAAAAGHPADRLQPAAQPGAAAVAHLPQRLEAG